MRASMAQHGAASSAVPILLEPQSRRDIVGTESNVGDGHLDQCVDIRSAADRECCRKEARVARIASISGVLTRSHGAPFTNGSER